MSFDRIVLGLICLSIFITTTFAGEVQLEPELALKWTIDEPNEIIDFTIVVGSKIPKVLIGLPLDAQSDISDVIVVTFDSIGNAIVTDECSVSNKILSDVALGGQNDILSSSSKGYEVTFSRKLVSKDTFDTPIENKIMKVDWGIGDSFETSSVHINFFAYGDVKACTNPLPNAYVPDGFCASVWASSLSNPRGIVTVSNQDMLVVETGKSQVTVFWEEGTTVRSALLAGGVSGLSHSLGVSGDFLYASTPTAVYRWRYVVGTRTNLGTAQRVVFNVPCCHHSSRTILFDKQGQLYLTVGSGSNVDPDSTHARIRRFNLANIPNGGISWDEGFLFADGLRNEVGITFDNQDRLWGVENGCDDLNRPDLGGDIHNTNPSEEVNLFAESGKFYGYPYCWSEFNLPTYGKGKGTQWVHPNFMRDGTHSDAWCQTPSNVVAPAWNMQPHTAPLDIKFYYGDSFGSFTNGAFISQHGSWDRQPPAGYRVIFLSFEDGVPKNETALLRHNGSAENWPNNVRPVGIAFRKCGTKDCMYVTSDASAQIIEISMQ